MVWTPSSENTLLFEWMVLDLSIPAETNADVGRGTGDFYEGKPLQRPLGYFMGPEYD